MPKEVVDLRDFVIQRSVLFQHPMTELEAFEVVMTSLGVQMIWGIPVNLTLAVIEKESKYDTKARSKAKCIGLTQLSPGTARTIAASLWWKKYNLHRPWENIILGMYYLFLLTEQYGLKNGLTVYNMGYKGWARIGKRPNQYSHGVIKRKNHLKKKLYEQ